MFISFGMFIGLIFLTIFMIIAIIFLTLTGTKNEKKKEQHTSTTEKVKEPLPGNQQNTDQHAHLTTATRNTASQQQDSATLLTEEDPFKVLPYPKEDEKGV
ncbi:hypothetical protein GIX45_09210 [Erwinia sp. CPCC 100877]|nr:hypothetical protein [Erwinia sp. CPCC 100877]